MNTQEYEPLADLFHILSHPVRLQILDELRKRETCVCHLQAVTDKPQAYISQQLRLLREADLVEDVKDGQNVFYHLKSAAVRRLLLDSLGEAGSAMVLPECNCPFCVLGDR